MTARLVRDGGPVLLVGRGKVGRALARACRDAGVAHTLVASGGRPPREAPSLVVLAVPDAAIVPVGARWADAFSAPSVMVHTAGLRSPDELASLRPRGWSVGQAHPLASFAGAASVSVAGATLLVGGDGPAVRRASRFGRRLGLRPLLQPTLARETWHAVAALVANGAAALAALGKARWVAAGVPPREAERALGALLASVAANVSALGLPRALSGPVRRGDVAAVCAHLEALEGPGGAARAYAALALAQVDLARDLGEADPAACDAIEVRATRALRVHARR